jgi:hypothetical protein
MRSQRHRKDIATTKEQILLQGKKYTNSLLRAHAARCSSTSSKTLFLLFLLLLHLLLRLPTRQRKPKTEKAVACFTTRKNKPRTKSLTLGSPGTLSHDRSATNPKYTHDTQVKHAQSHTQFLPHCTPPLKERTHSMENTF